MLLLLLYCLPLFLAQHHLHPLVGAITSGGCIHHGQLQRCLSAFGKGHLASIRPTRPPPFIVPALIRIHGVVGSNGGLRAKLGSLLCLSLPLTFVVQSCNHSKSKTCRSTSRGISSSGRSSDSSSR